MKYEILVNDVVPFSIKCKNKAEMLLRFKALLDFSDYDFIAVRGGIKGKKEE